MSKLNKSRLIHSYIYEDEDLDDEEDLKEEENNKIVLDIPTEARNSDPEPLISNNVNRNSNPINRNSKPKFTGENIEEKQVLYDMGFKSQLINTIYNNMHPIDLQEALDYLNKNDKGKFTHSYIENDRFICAICSQGRDAHENTALFLDNNFATNTGTDTGETNNDNLIEGNILPKSSQSNNENNNILNVNNTNNNNINSNITSVRPNRSSSERYNKFESLYLNSINKYNNNYSKPIDCGICAEKIEYPDSMKVKISCGHNFCVECWENYLTEKINNSNVVKISCMQHGCSVVLTKEFIKKILANDEALIQKYEKFLEKQNLLMSNKNIKFCPIPDCDGYAEKKDKNKYVKCNFGHDFCFECLKQPHGSQKCEEIIDADFEEWKKHKIVKRCPNCKIWTEKNEGCNHMTCVECKFQWCWLCQKKYSSGHYNTGSCKGLQFEKEQDEEKIKKMLEANLKKYPPPKPPKCQCLRKAIKKVLIFLLFLFFAPYFFFFRLQDEIYINDCESFTYMFSVVPTFIVYQIFFLTVNIIIVVPGLLFSRYYRELYSFASDPFEY